MVVEACKEFLPQIAGKLDDPRVHIYYEDGLKFVRRKVNEYDLIIVDSTDPFGPGEGLFTKEFYGNCYNALKEKGIAVQNFSVSVGHQAGDSSSNQSFNQWKQSLKIKNKATGDFVGLDDEQIINQNPYNYHEGRFDYRA
jgi:spermidine synthase